MDFLDPKKKKAHNIRLFIGYGLMAVLIGIISLILFLRSGGYHIDPRTGEVTQTGLLFIDAHPEPAQIKLNGQDKGTTAGRLNIEAGQYDLELSRAGYRTWQRKFTLEGGSIERLVYPFLFPQNLESSDIQLYGSQPQLISQSLDRRWLVIQKPGSVIEFDLLDLSTPAAAGTTIVLPAALVTTAGATHSYEVVEWSTDNIHLLLKHNFEGGSEFIVVNVETPASSINVNKSFAAAAFSAVSLRDKRYNLFYLYNQADMSLQAADLRNGQVSPVLSGVVSYKSHGNDVIAYVTAEGAAEGKVLLKVLEGTQSYTVRELHAGSSYMVDVARFDNSWYVVVSSVAEKKAFIYKNPVAAVKRLGAVKPVPVGALRLDKAPENLSFSANTRFIALQGGSQFSVYDSETDRQYRYETNLNFSANQKAYWMDGHRLVTAVDNKTVVFDYDGTNKQELTAAVSGFRPMFDRDYEAMFTLSPSVTVPERSAIVRTELLVAQ